MRIVFMGTPDFAAASLKKLIDRGFNVVGVFSQPDKPRNRGMRLSYSPVKEVALSAGLPVFQPTTLKDGKATEQLRALAADLIVVVAYGRILPDDILAVPPRGCINLHASLLPKYRGAAPIQWAILNGDKTTGVTTMYVSSKLDSGDIIYTAETEIGEFETSGQLLNRLRDMGAELLCKTVADIEKGVAPRTPQNHSQATYVTPLDKSMSPIEWNKSPREIVKWICGLNPWPVATAEFNGRLLRIFSAEYTRNRTEKSPGEIVAADNRGLEVACSGGQTLLITELQAPGGKRMSAADYLRGHPIPVGEDKP